MNNLDDSRHHNNGNHVKMDTDDSIMTIDGNQHVDNNHINNHDKSKLRGIKDDDGNELHDGYDGKQDNGSSNDFNTDGPQDQDNAVLIYDYLISRLNLSIHKELSSKSTMNTLKYMFYHMKCGIFVMIRNNKVVIFCPFVNRDYKNTWGKNTLKFGSRDGKKGVVIFLCIETYRLSI